MGKKNKGGIRRKSGLSLRFSDAICMRFPYRSPRSLGIGGVPIAPDASIVLSPDDQKTNTLVSCS